MKAIVKPLLYVIAIAAALLQSSCFFNCEDGNNNPSHRNYPAGNIRSVRVSCDAHVILVADSSFTRDSIRVEAESNILELIKVDIRGESLRIDAGHCYDANIQPVVYVPAREIDVLRVNGSGNITSKGKLKGNDVTLQVNGSGNIELNLETVNISSAVNGSGDIILMGTSQKHKISVNGSGNISAFEFITGRTYVTVNGSGDCRVFATSELDVKVEGSGNVYYKGTPKINTKISGSGSVSKQE